MLEDRDLKLDLLALGLLAVTIFLAAALLSYHPTDPPGKLVYPERTETLNVCGRSGALVSMVLFRAFGLGAYYLLFSLTVLDSLLLARRRIGQPVLRIGGWLLSLLGVTTLVAMAAPQLSPGPVIGSGGYFGATGLAVLETNFATIGAYILTLSMILGGLLLCTDYMLIRLFAWTVGVPVRAIGRGMLQLVPAYAAIMRRVGKAGLFGDVAEAGGKEKPVIAVRIAGRNLDEEDEEEENEDESNEEQAAEPDAPGPLRIKKPNRTKRDEVIEEIEAADDDAGPEDYELPSLDLLLESEPFCFDEHEKDVRHKAKVLEKTFANFGFQVHVVEVQTGPVIAQFEVELEAGLRLSKITSLADDLAIALRVPSVRIVAPIPGKNTVGIEIPNRERQLVRLREVMEETNGKALKMRIPLYLGKDVAGNPMVVDLSSLPHLLIAGRTGTGKSVCLNSMIASILMTRRPDEVRLLLIDPKLVELSAYKRIPHLMHPVVTDMRKAEAILGWAVDKMEERYQLLARAGVRHISVYNQLGEEELMERVQPEDDAERKQFPAGRGVHHPVGAEEPGGRDPPRAGHAEADRRRDYRPDQVESARPDFLPGCKPHRQPRGAGRDGRGKTARQRRHALPLARHEHAHPRAGDERRRDLRGDPRGGDQRTAVRPRVGPTQARRRRGRNPPARKPRRRVRGRRRRGSAGRPRQRLAVAADVGDRLRPGGPADRLHGRGRHRRALQRLASPRGPHQP
jgi:S-DNA-T family DNA segregation ATPase FtsK/SpoIIIE